MIRVFKCNYWLSILTIGDRVLIAVVTIAIGGLYCVEYSKDQGSRVKIQSEGDTQIYNMDEHAIRSLRGPKGMSELEVGSSGIRMRTSSCLFQKCVHRGWVQHQGDVIVCIPNRIVVTILGARLGVDAVSR